MSIRAQAAADMASIMADMDDVTLTSTEVGADPQPVKGIVARVSERLDPMSGEAIVDRKTVISVPMSAVDGEVEHGWSVSFDDEAGNTVAGTVVNVRPDYTVENWKFNVEDIS